MPATTLAPTRTDGSSRHHGGGPAGRDDGGRWGGGGQPRVPARTYHLAMWLALGAVAMFFAALTSALVVRRGLGGDWVSIPLPRALFFNTLVLVASSVTLELARGALREGLGARFAALLYATTALGLVFVAGQYVAWRELAAAGLYLASNPASSFFYVLTAAHAVHLLGGIGALSYVSARAGRLAAREMRATALDVTALYWHFMDGLWVYILLLLLVRF
jgi:cytochrome c oxidase subunit 3